MSAPLEARPHYRADIQGLRAVAVGAVLAFHLWPNRAPGGFVGVDVFFVISGFLITGHLLREIASTGTVLLRRFWAKRIARLLPAAFLVLAVVTVATFVFVPKNFWPDYFSQIRASALYFENWQLAWDATDYMAQDASPTALQHYWTLSVEEQFYVAWPLLIVVTLAITRHFWVRGSARIQLFVLLGGVALASLWFSVVVTYSDPAWAYFSSFTRVWEFAAGGLLAFAPTSLAWNSFIRWAMGWLGVFLVVLSCFVIGPDSYFPGYVALLPVAGAVMVLVAGGGARDGAGPLLTLKPLVWIGDISYSLYLWHWPLIVLLPFVTHAPLTTIDKLGIAAASLGLAWLTKRFVEDPMRTGTLLRVPWRAFILAAAGGAVFALVGWFAIDLVERAKEQAEAKLTNISVDVAQSSAEIELPTGCLGPAALDARSECLSPMGDGDYLVGPEIVGLQTLGDEFPGCQQGFEATEPVGCFLGDASEDPRLRVVLLGDSHASQWLPGFDESGKRHGWAVSAFAKVSCPPSSARRVLEEDSASDKQQACRDWTDNAVSEIADGDADVVVLTSFQSAYGWAGDDGQEGAAAAIEGFADVFAQLADAGKQVLVVKAVPRTMGSRVPDCLVLHGRSEEQCAARRTEALPEDYMADAVELLDRPDVSLVNLDEQLCDDEWCYPVVGDIVAYMDYSHVSHEFARALMPWVAQAVEAAVTNPSDQ